MVPIATFITEIDINTGRQLAPQQLLRYSKAGSGVCEGPHIFRKDDYLYLITADGGTEIEHQQWVSRSTDGPYGPWEIGPEGSINPMIYNGMHPEVRQTGHMDLVEGPDGMWWAVFLGVRPIFGDNGETLLSPLGRETFLAPVEWQDGWPIVNKRKPITINGLQDSVLQRIPEAFSIDLSFSPGKGKPAGSDTYTAMLIKSIRYLQVGLVSFAYTLENRARSSPSARKFSATGRSLQLRGR